MIELLILLVVALIGSFAVLTRRLESHDERIRQLELAAKERADAIREIAGSIREGRPLTVQCGRQTKTGGPGQARELPHNMACPRYLVISED